MKKLLLIDSHALIHRMYHAMAPLTTPSGEPIGAVYGLSQILLRMMAETSPVWPQDSSPRCPACGSADVRREEKIDETSSASTSNAISGAVQAATRREQSKISDRGVTPPRSAAKGTPSSSVPGAQGFLTCSRCGALVARRAGPDYVAACFDRPEPTFRKEAFKEYKAHRAPTPDDLISQLIKSREVFAAFKIKMFELPGFEADDLIATLATKMHNEKDLQVTILSGDRDLLQLVEDDHIVVELFKNGGGETTHMNEQAVLEKYGLYPNQIIDLKGLIGDPSDNIPGIKGVGEKTATPLLKEFKTVEGVFENLVIVPQKVAKKFEGHQDIALLSKKLATLERNVPIFLDSIEDVRALPLDTAQLTSFFESLGFTSLVRRLSEPS